MAWHLVGPLELRPKIEELIETHGYGQRARVRMNYGYQIEVECDLEEDAAHIGMAIPGLEDPLVARLLGER